MFCHQIKTEAYHLDLGDRLLIKNMATIIDYTQEVKITDKGRKGILRFIKIVIL